MNKLIDRDNLHGYLWEQADRRHVLRIHQRQLAETLNISHWHLCRILREFEDGGRIKKIGTRYKNVGVYQILEPALSD